MSLSSDGATSIGWVDEDAAHRMSSTLLELEWAKVWVQVTLVLPAKAYLASDDLKEVKSNAAMLHGLTYHWQEMAASQTKKCLALEDELRKAKAAAAVEPNDMCYVVLRLNVGGNVVSVNKQVPLRTTLSDLIFLLHEEVLGAKGQLLNTVKIAWAGLVPQGLRRCLKLGERRRRQNQLYHRVPEALREEAHGVHQGRCSA